MRYWLEILYAGALGRPSTQQKDKYLAKHSAVSTRSNNSFELVVASNCNDIMKYLELKKSYSLDTSTIYDANDKKYISSYFYPIKHNNSYCHNAYNWRAISVPPERFCSSHFFNSHHWNNYFYQDSHENSLVRVESLAAILNGEKLVQTEEVFLTLSCTLSSDFFYFQFFFLKDNNYLRKKLKDVNF